MLIGRGDVAEAAKLLGRRFALRGTVVKGEQIGRTIGYPTANIQTAPRQLLPARGVYVVESTVGTTTYSGVCNVGVRPTFNGSVDSVEVHLAGFGGNIYGETMDVVFCRRLRDEMAFESPERLADQIRKDLERAVGFI
jgi:riboflavin kinase/FMN adenylyltransferase